MFIGRLGPPLVQHPNAERITSGCPDPAIQDHCPVILDAIHPSRMQATRPRGDKSPGPHSESESHSDSRIPNGRSPSTSQDSDPSDDVMQLVQAFFKETGNHSILANIF